MDEIHPPNWPACRCDSCIACAIAFRPKVNLHFQIGVQFAEDDPLAFIVVTQDDADGEILFKDLERKDPDQDALIMEGTLTMSTVEVPE